MAPRQEFQAYEPVLMKCQRGWMAYSPAHSSLRIAVIAPTEEKAVERYKDRLEMWEALWRAKDSPR